MAIPVPGDHQGDASASFGDAWKSELQDRIDHFIDSLQLGGLEREGEIEEEIATHLYTLAISSRSVEVRLAERCIALVYTSLSVVLFLQPASGLWSSSLSLSEVEV